MLEKNDAYRTMLNFSLYYFFVASVFGNAQ